MPNISGTYTGAALKAILDGAQPVVLTGNVTVTSALEVDNASLVMYGTGPQILTCASGISLKQYTSFADMRITANLTYPDDSTAHGSMDSVVIIGSITGGTNGAYNNAPAWNPGWSPGYTGLSFPDCEVTGLVQGAFDSSEWPRATVTGGWFISGSGNDLSTLTVVASGTYDATCVRLPSHQNGYYAPETGNIYRYGSFSGGKQECFSVDSNAVRTLYSGTVSSKTADSITFAVVWDNFSALNPDSHGAELVGQYVFIALGIARGRWYLVTAQDDWTVTIDTTMFSTLNVEVGDFMVVGSFFVGNSIQLNTFHLNGDTSTNEAYAVNSGLLLWGGCIANDVRENTAITYAGYPEATGFIDASITMYGSHYVSLNGRNRWYDNTVVNTGGTLRNGMLVGTWCYQDGGEEMYLASSSPSAAYNVLAELVRNDVVGPLNLRDAHDVGLSGNTYSALNTTPQYQNAMEDAYGGPLFAAGDTSVTYQDPFTPHVWTGLTLAADARWSQEGTAISVTAPRTVRTSVEATASSSLGGTLKFVGEHAARFTCSLDDVAYAATQTLPAGTTTVYLGVTPEEGDNTLTARVGVPV